MENSWHEKYKPASIKELVCNNDSVKILCEWLNDYDMMKNNLNKNKKSSKKHNCEPEFRSDDKNFKKNKKNNYKPNLLICGNHGIGKTSALDIVTKKYNYDVLDINVFLKNNLKGKNMNSIFCGNNIINMIDDVKQKKILIIDDVDSLSSVTDKTSILTLIKSNEAQFCFPIIFVSNSQHSKFLSEIKKKSNIVRFKTPSYTELRCIIENITKCENMVINEMLLDKIIENSQYDIRKLISILHDIKTIFGKNITDEQIDYYFETIGKKDIDVELYTATNNLLFNYKNISDCYTYYDKEKVLLPLMLLQNYINVINIGKNIDKICEISECFSIGDVIENNIYGDQIWDIQDIHGLYCCVLQSYLLRKIKDKLKNQKITFTIDLNKTSIKNINKKNITGICKYYNNTDIFDILRICEIVKKIIHYPLNEFENIIVKNKMKFDIIDTILKIDKINESKISLTTKQKRDIATLFSEEK